MSFTHHTPVRMAIIIRRGNKYWQGCGEMVTHIYCSWKCNLAQPAWKTLQIFKRYKSIAIQPNNLITLCVCVHACTREIIVSMRYVICHVNFSQVQMSQNAESTKVSIKKENTTHSSLFVKMKKQPECRKRVITTSQDGHKEQRQFGYMNKIDLYRGNKFLMQHNTVESFWLTITQYAFYETQKEGVHGS